MNYFIYFFFIGFLTITGLLLFLILKIIEHIDLCRRYSQFEETYGKPQAGARQGERFPGRLGANEPHNQKPIGGRTHGKYHSNSRNQHDKG